MFLLRILLITALGQRFIDLGFKRFQPPTSLSQQTLITCFSLVYNSPLCLKCQRRFLVRNVQNHASRHTCFSQSLLLFDATMRMHYEGANAYTQNTWEAMNMTHESYAMLHDIVHSHALQIKCGWSSSINKKVWHSETLRCCIIDVSVK